MSQKIAKVVVKIKFTRYCVLDVPAEALTWDNTALGGGASDDSIIIKVKDDKRSFRMTSPFVHISKA